MKIFSSDGFRDLSFDSFTVMLITPVRFMIPADHVLPVVGMINYHAFGWVGNVPYRRIL